MTKRGRRAALLLLAALATLGVLVGTGAGTAADIALHPSVLTVTAGTRIHCDWTVAKSASNNGSPVTSLTLAVGEAYTIDYTVTVTKTCTNIVSGTVSGSGSPSSVSVTVGGLAATVSGCAYDSSANTFSCNYVANPTTTAGGTVNASASFTDASTGSGSTTYSFVGVHPEEDTVGVFDSYAGTLAVHLPSSQTFNYSRTVSFTACGSYTVDNTARVVDSVELGRASVSIPVTVPCPTGGGCTLTQGYWKTHSILGPASKPDATWNLVGGPNATFYLSGQSWIQVFRTSPSGNAYYNLAHQYMAAVLNTLNGASTTAAVDSAMSWAKTFFSTRTPAQIGALKGSDPLRAQALAAAATLGSYNEGLIGPGHCSE
ncbi:MAG: hypothetical protein QOE13_3038 [Gaiellaceae bacterium]|nr:hypothetical protein [Gaiellaceae bacterium]